MQLQKAVDQFLLTRRAENAAPNTIKSYREDLSDLLEFVGSSARPSDIGRIVIRAFLLTLAKRGLSKPTIVRRLFGIKALTRWMLSEGIIADDFAEGIHGLKGPKLPDRLPLVPSPREMGILLNGEFPTAFPERDRLICELLYGQGLRVSEAAGITLDDLRPEQRTIHIRGKGGMYGKEGKFRLVPLNQKTQAALDAYLPVREAMLKKHKLEAHALFFGLRNNPGKSISVRSIGRMLKRLSKVRKLQPMHPHLLRHACATHLLENRCPLDVIAAILGHDRLDVTAHYAQVSTRFMMDSYNAAHPHARAA